jgi:hypothetical protein
MSQQGGGSHWGWFDHTTDGKGARLPGSAANTCMRRRWGSFGPRDVWRGGGLSAVWVLKGCIRLLRTPREANFCCCNVDDPESMVASISLVNRTLPRNLTRRMLLANRRSARRRPEVGWLIAEVNPRQIRVLFGAADPGQTA